MIKLVLPYDDWPIIDRQAWQMAIRKGDILDGRGPAAHWRPSTCRINVRHYGGWLSFLLRHGKLYESTEPAERVTKENVKAYVDELRARVAPRTMVSALVGLKVMMKAMAPDVDWRWLEDVCNRLNRSCAPIKGKRCKMRSTREIVVAALSELDRLIATPLTRRIERVAFRDALMLALMALRPLRLGNFTSLDLGGRFSRLGETWQIEIPGFETKNGDPIAFEVPDQLLPYLEIYLSSVRPAFLGESCDECAGALWLTYKGAPLEYHSIYCRLVQVSKRLLGVAINPHLLRDCAATTLSARSVDDALASAPLLGHRNFATTEKYYIRANRLEASRAVMNTIAKIAGKRNVR